MSQRRWLAVGFILATGPTALSAQEMVIPGGEISAYFRFLEINGWNRGMPLLFQSTSSLRNAVPTDSAPWRTTRATDQDPTRPRVAPLPIDFRGVYNSTFPWGVNDGPLWAGRGGSFAVSGGVAARLGRVRIDLYPTFWLAGNQRFDLAPQPDTSLSIYANPWHPGRIDLPQRFGASGITALDPGQSSARLTVKGLTLGLSSENMVWGPAIENPIIMSANAAGFPHLDLGSERALRTPIGLIEFRLLWGRLSESQFFDTVAGNDHRLFTGLTLGISPRGLPGLTLGLTRVLYTTWTDSLRAADAFDVFQPFFKRSFASTGNPEGDDYRDQMLSLVARWLFPTVGFEAYLEWARNDHSANLRDLILEPDHSQAFTAGFGKTLGHARRTWLRGELTHLERSPTFQLRATPTYYVHHLVVQGYTQRGQIIGAGIGPGSNSQSLAVDRYTSKGRWGAFIRHVNLDEDVYYARFVVPGGPANNVQLTAGVSAMRRFRSFEIGAQAALTREYNRYYVDGQDVTNLSLGINARYRP